MDCLLSDQFPQQILPKLLRRIMMRLQGIQANGQKGTKGKRRKITFIEQCARH